MDIAIGYLASDKPFQNRLGPQASAQGGGGEKEGGKEEEAEEGDEKGTEGAAQAAVPLMEALCDTVWGVDAMVSYVALIDNDFATHTYLEQIHSSVLCGSRYCTYNTLVACAARYDTVDGLRLSFFHFFLRVCLSV